MKKSISILGIAVIVFTLMSCSFSGVVGSKNVIKQNRKITENFKSIAVSTGIDLILSQGEKRDIIVEADDNIIDLLKTEVKDGVLRVYFDKSIVKAKAKKVYITIPTIISIVATSGAEVENKSEISGEEISLSASSGAEIDLVLKYNKIICSASSGAEVEIKGGCNNLTLDASSGSNIEAKELLSKNVTVNASSGANIKTLVSENISADASSGGNINYYGEPKVKNISKSSGGSVSEK